MNELEQAWDRYVNSDIKPILMLAERLQQIHEEREAKKVKCPA